MKNKDSKARMQMIFGILLFAFIFMAELYAIVNFPKMFIVLVVLAAADLICLYVAIRGVISVYETKYARREEQYESIFKSEKASYLMLKKYFEEISVKLAYMEEASKIPTEEIVNAQKGIAKVIIKRSHENTDALMNSYEQLIDRFDTFQKGMDGFGTVAGAYKDEILSAYKDEKSPVPAPYFLPALVRSPALPVFLPYDSAVPAVALQVLPQVRKPVAGKQPLSDCS